MSLVLGGQTTKQAEGKNRNIVNTYWEEIAEQEIPDHDLVRPFGSHEAIGTTEVVLSEAATGQQFYLAANDTIDLVSSDDEDGGAGTDTGALTATVIGLVESGGDWIDQSETLALNGDTAVTTTKEFIRVFRVKIASAGSVGSNIGTITISDNGTSTTIMKMTPGHNSTQACLFTVKTGKKLLIRNWWATAAGAKPINVHLYIRPPGGVFVLEDRTALQDSEFNHNILLNGLAAKTDLELRVQTAAGSAGVCMGGFVGRIENA